jgi:hypothetical protein
MANEIWHSYDETKTLYALIWRQTDDKVYDAVAAANTFDTYTDTDIDDYDIPLTNHADSDYHSVDFPSDITVGVYRVQVFDQVGGSINADDDIVVAQGEIYWDGSAELNMSSLDTKIDDEVIGADGDTHEDLSDQLDALSAEESKVLNVYREGE